MSQGQDINQASFEQRFLADEDELVDALLALLRRELWENLEMHYEAGNLSAEKTVLREHAEKGVKEEFPVTLALAAQWLAGEDEEEVDLVVDISESEYDWTLDECQSTCESILTALKTTFAVVEKSEFKDSDNGHSRSE
jgi:hypothetical protein